MRTPLAAALVILAGLGLFAGCGDADQATPSPGNRTDHAGWKRLADPPLSPRFGQITVWTGSEVLVVGGDIGPQCPANASCIAAPEAARDGAAYDPEKNTWRPIADAPTVLSAYAKGVLVKGHLFIGGMTALLDYEVATDRWTTLHRESVSVGYELVADGRRLLLVSGSDENDDLPDLSYDVPTQRWSELPEDPIGPAYDRTMITTPYGPLLEARELVPNPGGDGPSLVRAALLDPKTGTWTRFPDTGQIGGGFAAWTGTRVVDPVLGGSDGGDVGNHGRTYPFGGAIDLTTKAWSALPDPPKEFSGGWAVEAVGPSLIASGGWIYDDAHRSWTKIPVPSGAAPQPGRAVWIGEGRRLIVVGGYDGEQHAPKDAYDVGAWSWEPVTGGLQ